jgi:23S rRNA pseudouridine1911/1915/1917 synthase
MNRAGFDEDRKALYTAFPHQALHAAELSFVHPGSRETLHFSAPVPDDLAALIS